MIRKEYIVRLIYTIVISIAISVAVSCIFYPEGFSAGTVIKSVGLGTLIWLVAELILDAVTKKWPHHILPSYLALFVIIALGTGFGTWLLGMTSVTGILIICACAEAFGFLIAVIYRSRYQKKLNRQLEKFKAQKK